jgi:hypothetical protein
MFFNRTNVIIHVIFCMLSIVPGSVIAMQHKEFSSDIHFYGKQRESRERTHKNTTNSMPQIEAAPLVIKKSNESIASIHRPLAPIPTITITDAFNDVSRDHFLNSSDKLPILAGVETLPSSGLQQDIYSKMHHKLSRILTKLQEEAMSENERRESFLMLKNEAHEWLKTSMKESKGNVVSFAELGAKAYALMEKIEQAQRHECRALKAQCLVAQPDLDELD